MDLLKLTEDIVKSLVDEKDLVALKEFPTDNEKERLIEILVAESDMPKVIGKEGRIINAIRTIAQASSYKKDNKIIKINIDSI